MNELLESNKPDMQTIAHIDTELYACVVKNIRSDRVVLLENQKEHIIKRSCSTPDQRQNAGIFAGARKEECIKVVKCDLS